jgi:hypothetical protein
LQSIRFAAGPSNAGGTVPPQKADIINLSLTLSRLWRLAKSNQAAVERGGSRPGDVVMSSLPYSRDRDRVILRNHARRWDPCNSGQLASQRA